jgi:hypothetical protein
MKLLCIHNKRKTKKGTIYCTTERTYYFFSDLNCESYIKRQFTAKIEAKYTAEITNIDSNLRLEAQRLQIKYV